MKIVADERVSTVEICRLRGERRYRQHEENGKTKAPTHSLSSPVV